MERYKKPLLGSLAAAVAVGIIVGLAFMNVAWEHNPQGAYHNEDGIDWGYLLALGGTWTALVAGVLAPVFALFSCAVVAAREAVRDRPDHRAQKNKA